MPTSLPAEESLNIPAFSTLFQDTSACYKFFWFQAIITKVIAGETAMSFDELVNEMIVQAWYMVTEYHLNLSSVTDNVEHAVRRLAAVSGFLPNERRDRLIGFLENCDDAELNRIKGTLIVNVPYRLQAPLLQNFSGNDWKVGASLLTEHINTQRERLIYYFEAYQRLNTRIVVNEAWQNYIVKNQVILQGWIQFNLVNYLQKKNPNVPGIIQKLHAPEARNLDLVKKYWKLIVASRPTYEIYRNEELSSRDISIDHFVPWSYVAHDEFWNLHPTTRAINSSKSNHLPRWDVYFERFGRMEYEAYRLRNENEALKNAFHKCAEEHINSDEARRILYCDELSFERFFNGLREIVQPVYQSAKNAGFSEWEI